jgi:hypothetical protein
MRQPAWISLLFAFSTACAVPTTSPSAADVAPPRAASTEAAPPPPSPVSVAEPTPVPWKGTPVVVELFSSEGCSSCPPADAVLRELSDKQPVEGAAILALEMHVDYWDDLGWKDPFSSDVYTSRQRAYSYAFGERGMYTPEMVVDGQVGFVGSQARTAREAIARAAKTPKARVDIKASGDSLAVTVSDLPDGAPAANVMLVLAEEGLSSEVKRGENAGSVLVHAPVVRAIKKIGSVAPNARGKAFEGAETVTIPAAWKRDRLRAVAFVQARETLAILGAGAAVLN